MTTPILANRWSGLNYALKNIKEPKRYREKQKYTHLIVWLLAHVANHHLIHISTNEIVVCCTCDELRQLCVRLPFRCSILYLCDMLRF